MIIFAALDGIKNDLPLPEACDRNLFAVGEDVALEKLPRSLEEAKALARQSTFVSEKLTETIINSFVK